MFQKVFLVKLLHHKYSNRTGAAHQSYKNSLDESINIKNENMQKCRVCLKEGDIPIFGDLLLEDISENLRYFAGIEIDIDDKYPKFICNTCHTQLKNAIQFRKTAKNSDMMLRKLKPDIDSNDDGDFANDSVMSDVVTKKHKRTRKDANSFICNKCNITFDNFERYSDHIDLGHESARRVCPQCNKSIKESYFRKHLALHNNATYICDICGKPSVNRNEFQKHRLTHFFNLPFKCSLCPYRGRFKECLKLHMRTHTGERPYQCDKCPARFVTKSNLNKHSNTHKDTYDFVCDCGRGFFDKRKYEMHIRIDHGGIKEHVCNICNKAFGYRKQMMKHQLKVHKREKLRSGKMPIYLQVEQQQKTQIDETNSN